MALRAFYEVSNWYTVVGTGGSFTVTGVAYTAGDRLVAWAMTEDSSHTLSAVTGGTGLTWSAVSGGTITTGSNECNVYLWEALAASTQTGQTITFPKAGSGDAAMGGCVWVNQGDGGAVSNAATSRTEGTFSAFTPTASSVVGVAIGDWNAASGFTGVTGTGTLTEREDSTNSSNYGVWVGDWAPVTATSTAFGLTSYTGRKVTQTRFELKAGSVPVSRTPSDAFGVTDVRRFEWGLRRVEAFGLDDAVQVDATGLRVRSVDDTVGLDDSVSVDHGVAGGGTIHNLWPHDSTQGTLYTSDTDSPSVGTRVMTSVNGTVNGIWFQKGNTRTETHVVSLWRQNDTDTGVTMLAEKSSVLSTVGWHLIEFDTPVAVGPLADVAGVAMSYVAVCYYHGAGNQAHYYLTGSYFSSAARTSGPLTSPIGTTANNASRNGRFVYPGATPVAAYPTGSFNEGSYFIDVEFEVATAGTTRTPSDAFGVTDSVTVVRTHSRTVADTLGVTDTRAVVRDHVRSVTDPTGIVDSRAVVRSGARTIADTVGVVDARTVVSSHVRVVADSVGVTDSPSVTATGAHSRSPADAVGVTDSVQVDHDVPADVVSIWEGATLGTFVSGDTDPVNLGTRFRASVAGSIVGVAFRRRGAGSGSHTYQTALYDNNGGTPLATANVVSGVSDGAWTASTFTTPVEILPDTTYLVRVHYPTGNYYTTAGYFSSVGHTNGPLHAIAVNEFDSGQNGVYLYGAAAFPTSSASGGSYFIDVAFAVEVVEPVDHTRGPTDTVGVTDSVTVDTVAVHAASPAELVGLTDSVQVDVDAGLEHFTIWEGADLGTLQSGDTDPVNVGTRFRVNVAGEIVGIAFRRRGAGTGSHTYSTALYDNDGPSPLASADVVSTVSDGSWTSSTFATPVEITPDTTYIARVHYPTGRYYSTTGYFATTGFDNDPLHANASGEFGSGQNGIYLYSGTPGFPTDSSGSLSFFVDVVFAAEVVEDVDHTRTPSDTVGLTDSVAVTATGQHTRSRTDTLGLTDTVTAVKLKVRTVADTLGVVDSGQARAITEARTESLGLTDTRSVTATGQHSRSRSDPLALIDTVTRTSNWVRSRSDTLGVTDSVVVSHTAAGATRTITDTVGLHDAVTVSVTSPGVRTVADTLGLDDTVTRVSEWVRSRGDTVGLDDTVQVDAAGVRARDVSDSVGVGDTITVTVTYTRSVADDVVIADSATVTATGSAYPTDTLSITDTVTVVRTNVRIVADRVGLNDNAYAAVPGRVNVTVTSAGEVVLEPASAGTVVIAPHSSGVVLL